VYALARLPSGALMSAPTPRLGCAEVEFCWANCVNAAQLGSPFFFYLFFSSLLSSLSNLNFKFESICVRFKPRLNVYIFITIWTKF
jgi:hypothetical protein